MASNEVPAWNTVAVDIAKTTIGAFAGAMFAFGLTVYRDRRLRLREQRAAGNSAMSVITRQYMDFCKVKREIEADCKIIREAAPNAPKWMKFRPTPSEFNDALRFDMKSLDFLFEHGHAEIVDVPLRPAERVVGL